jgi:hypothetical protein
MAFVGCYTVIGPDLKMTVMLGEFSSGMAVRVPAATL